MQMPQSSWQDVGQKVGDSSLVGLRANVPTAHMTGPGNDEQSDEVGPGGRQILGDLEWNRLIVGAVDNEHWNRKEICLREVIGGFPIDAEAECGYPLGR